MLGALGEFFGALAVVASLLYVGHQLRQNNRIARSDRDSWRALRGSYSPDFRSFLEERYDMSEDG